jgi:uncharacterized protein DUF4236
VRDPWFCAVASHYPQKCADNHAMGFRFRRSIKILPGIRLNFGKRGISTSIGVRGAHVTFGKTGTRATVGLPGSGISYTHLDKPRREGLVASAPDPAPDSSAPAGKAWRGCLWIALLVFAIIAAVAQVMQ